MGDRKRAAYQDLVADGLMEREEGRSKVRELEVSRKKILSRYREAAPEELEMAEGKKCRAVYNTLGVTVWAAKAKDDPIRIEMSALGGEEVCRSDVTSRRFVTSANPARLKLTLISSDGDLEAAFTLNHNVI